MIFIGRSFLRADGCGALSYRGAGRAVKEPDATPVREPDLSGVITKCYRDLGLEGARVVPADR
jgi:hypothetical protein